MSDTSKCLNDAAARTGYGEASASEVREIFSACYKAHFPVMLIGDPGVGKTALINAWADENGLGEPIILIGSQMEPQDIVGLPMASTMNINGKNLNITEYGMPWWQAEIMSGKRKVLFFDEFSNSPASIQSGELKLIGDKRFGNGEKVPDNVFIVLAMNPESSAVDYTPIAAPMANRMMFVSYKPTDKEVYDGLSGGWYSDAQKKAWSTSERQWRTRIVSFLKSTNGMYIAKMNNLDSCLSSAVPAYLNPDNEHSDAEKEILTTSWPSPRAWDNVARVLGTTPFEREITRTQERMLAGTVGRQASVELCEYVHEHAGLDGFEVIKNPEIQDWNVSSNDGSSYNDILELARDINEKIPLCDGIDGHPNLKQALDFYDKVIDLGGGPHFAAAFCRDEHGPGSYLRKHRPSNVSMREWSKEINQVFVKFTQSDYIPHNNVTNAN